MNTGKKSLEVLVVGLGLIGGSFAAALKRHYPNWQIVGFDTSVTASSFLLEQGYIDTLTSKEEMGVDLKAADLIVLALPILAIIEFLEDNHGNFKDGAIILDVGSTKSKIISTMNALPKQVQYIGGHPMTGKKTAGVNGPSPKLYEQKLFILTPSVNTADHTVAFVSKIIKDIGGKLMRLPAEEHDFIVAVASHLPYLLPVLLLNSAKYANNDKVWEVAAGGFKKIAESAAENIPMWEDILVTNNESISNALDLLVVEITKLKELLRENDENELREYLETVKGTKSHLF